MDFMLLGFLFPFQMPVLLSQVKEALGLPSASVPVAPVPAAATACAPPIPVLSSSTAPPIVVEDSGSDSDIQTLAVPFRSGSPRPSFRWPPRTTLGPLTPSSG